MNIGNLWWQNFWLWFMVLMTFGWVVTTWIRARYGYPVEDSLGGKTELPFHARKLEEALADRDDRIARLEERIRVLERIVTDTHKSHVLSEEIESLRGREARL